MSDALEWRGNVLEFSSFEQNWDELWVPCGCVVDVLINEKGFPEYAMSLARLKGHVEEEPVPLQVALEATRVQRWQGCRHRLEARAWSNGGRRRRTCRALGALVAARELCRQGAVVRQCRVDLHHEVAGGISQQRSHPVSLLALNDKASLADREPRRV